MVAKRRKLNVLLSATSLATLDQIWDWNAKHYGGDHADQYIRFIREEADKLATDYGRGRQVPSRPDMHYVTIKRSRRGHGHIAVYEIVADAVTILDFFHTAQDWQNRLPDATGR